MEFKESFIATGIGSFPHKEEEEVITLILRDFPIYPSGRSCPNALSSKGW